MAQSAYSGNLRVELESPALCNVHLERSYLVLILIYSCDQPHSLDKIDFSKELVSWVKTEKYSLLDVNLFPRPFAHLVRHFFFCFPCPILFLVSFKAISRPCKRGPAILVG